MRWVAGLVLALVAGLAGLYAVTAGLTALTAEGARRQDVAQHPRALPAVPIVRADGSTASLADELRHDGRVAIVSFFYSRCMSLCLAQGSQIERLQRSVIARNLGSHIRLLSLSFDPRDRVRELKDYARRMGADTGIWAFAAMPDAQARRQALQTFGIVVVPAELGEFEHNAAFHVVTPDGHLARILDIDAPGEALAAAIAIAGMAAGGQP